MTSGELPVSGFSWIHTRKGSSSGAILGRLVDRGKTWQDVRIAPEPSQYPGYWGFFTAVDGTVYGFTNFGGTSEPRSAAMIVSHDGGATFQRKSTLTIPAPTALWRAPRGPLIGVGSGGGIWRSLDDGTTWQPKSTHPWGEATLQAVWSDGGHEVWAVGEKCTVLRSGDAGATFEVHHPCAPGADGVLTSVWASGPNDVYVGGPALFHFSEGRRLGTVTPAGAKASTWRIWGSGADNVYAAGFEAGLFQTKDQGRSWQQRRAGRDEIPAAEIKWAYGGCLFGVFGTDAHDLYLATDINRGFLHSVDQGAHWEAPSPMLSCPACFGASIRPETISVEAPHSLLGTGRSFSDLEARRRNG